MRSIAFSFSESAITPTEPQYAGVQGEHNATEVQFTLPQAWMQAGYRVRAEFVDGTGTFDTSEFLPCETNTVTVTLPYGWTAAGGLGEIRLAAATVATAGLPEQTVVYSPVGYLYFDSREGEPDCWRSFENRGLSALIADARAAAAEAAVAAETVVQQASDGDFNGTMWHFGTAVSGTAATVTAQVDGTRVGDIYWNTAAYTIYVQTAAGTWQYLGCARGATGATGAAGADGADGAPGENGADGLPGGLILPSGSCAGSDIHFNTVSPAVAALTDGLTVLQTFTGEVPCYTGYRVLQLAVSGANGVPVVARFRDDGEASLAAGTYLLRYDAASNHMKVTGRVYSDAEIAALAAVKATVTGDTLAVTDSAGYPVLALTLTGKSWQDGTPTPTAPVPVQHTSVAGEDGQFHAALTVSGGDGQSQIYDSVTTVPLARGDTVDLLTGAGVRRFGCLVLDGVSSGRCVNSASHYAASDTDYAVINIENSIYRSVPVCTHFIGAADRCERGYCYISAGGTRAVICHTGTITTVAQWNAWLAAQYAAGTPVTLWYELAAPETFAIAPVTPDTYAGTTAVTPERNAAVTMRYIADSKLYVDEKIADLTALILEV